MTLPARLLAKGAVATLLMSLGTITAGTGVALAVAGAATNHGITTVAGNGTAAYNGDNQPAVNAELNFGPETSPAGGVAEDATGALYIADSANNLVRKVVHPTKASVDTITTFAGTPGQFGSSGDGHMATAATLNNPTAVDFDNAGNLYVADTNNNKIREVLTTGVIKTFAGNGTCGSKWGDKGLATSAELCHPTGVVADGLGHVFIADSGHHAIRMVNPSGTISTYAGSTTGTCGFSGDGNKATMAKLCNPTGLALDSSRDLFIADTGNSRVREVTENGNIKTFAGDGTFGYSDGGTSHSPTSAALNAPTGVGVDQTGNVYITDTKNNRIRLVSGGQISVYAGNGTKGFSGDNDPNGADATAAMLDTPTGSTAIDGIAFYFADSGNERVRAVFNGPAPVLPETNWLILLPIGTGLILAGGTGIVIFRRRRRVTPTPAV
jgi:hypothetical protein